jgi:Uma2 family endonuclease
MVAVSKRYKAGKFLKKIHSVGDLMEGKEFLLFNHLFIFKNGKSFVAADLSEEREYTADDYLKLPEGAPFQLIQGKLTHMPSPFDFHQDVSFRLSGHFFNYLQNHLVGIARHAPLDVHFDAKNVYQPDLLFVSNERKHIVKGHIYGAPDLVVEIISKGTETDDRKTKMEVYGKYNVLEYWIITPESKQVEVYVNISGVMSLKSELHQQDLLSSELLPGFSVPVASLFE